MTGVDTTKKSNLPALILAIVGIPSVALAAGLGQGYARGDLSRIATESGVALDAVEQEIFAGRLLLGAVAGISVLCVVMLLANLLNRTATTGRRIAKAFSMTMSVVLLVGMIGLGVWLYPQFQDMVATGG